MSKMDERELLSNLDALISDAVANNAEFMALNETLLSEYNQNPYGDEQPDESQVVMSDVADVVDSDMTSLMRVFSGSKSVHIFEPMTSSPEAKREAEEKTAFVNWIIQTQENSYKTIADWCKDALMLKLGVVRFGVRDTEKAVEKEFSGQSVEEIIMILEQLKKKASGEVEIVEQSDDGAIKVRYTIKKRKFIIENIPVDNFLLSRNAKSVQDALLVGDKCMVTKSYLVEMGYDAELIKALPAYSKESTTSSGVTGNLKALRHQDQGGQSYGKTVHWTNEEVELYNVYPLIDYDGDGIAERRHILKVDDVILENEAFEIAPYAMFSAITMPHTAIGRSRGELASTTQRVRTFLTRQLMNNIACVGNPGVVVNDSQTNIDDLLVRGPNYIVRTDGHPMEAVAPLTTPYIGEGVLQVIQFFDSARAQSTGHYMANQGLDSDQLYNETATRFIGVQEEGEAKIELVARNMAETGWRDLYIGLAWLAERYQSEECEIMALGEPMKVNPQRWTYDHHLSCQVGLAVGDNENTIKNITGLLQIDSVLKQAGSMIVDEKKTYNKLAKMVRALGFSKVSEFYNDPEQPDEVLLAQNEMLMNKLEEAQAMIQQMQNPLAEVENIKAQKEFALKRAQLDLEQAKLGEDKRQFNLKTTSDRITEDQRMIFEATKLEATTGQDIPRSQI